MSRFKGKLWNILTRLVSFIHFKFYSVHWLVLSSRSGADGKPLSVRVRDHVGTELLLWPRLTSSRWVKMAAHRGKFWSSFFNSSWISGGSRVQPMQLTVSCTQRSRCMLGAEKHQRVFSLTNVPGSSHPAEYWGRRCSVPPGCRLSPQPWSCRGVQRCSGSLGGLAASNTDINGHQGINCRSGETFFALQTRVRLHRPVKVWINMLETRSGL